MQNIRIVGASGFNGMEWWTGIVEWNDGVEWWNGIVDRNGPFLGLTV